MAQLKVFSLGGIGHPCCCTSSGCNTTICATGCNGGVLPGATVTVKSGATVIATGTSSSGSGCVTLNVGTAGSYTVVISATGYTTSTTTESLTCGGTVTKALTTSGGSFSCGCCQGYIPYASTPLFLTDANGTISLTFNGSLGWNGCYTLSLANTLGKPGGFCTTTGTFLVAIHYGLSCNGGTGFSVQRSWEIQKSGGGCFGWTYGSSQTNGCASNDCGNTVETSQSTVRFEPCTLPISWSFSLTPTSGNCSTEPVTGSVVINS